MGSLDVCPTCSRALPIIDSSSNDDDDGFVNVIDVPEYSKREYLLAQIRQKDAIIESLLKQVSIV